MQEPPNFANYPRYAPPPKVRFDVIGEAFSLFGKAAGAYMLASVPLLILTLAYFGAYLYLMLSNPAFQQTGTPNIQEALVLDVVLLAVTLVFTVLQYMMLSGLTRMAIKHIRTGHVTAGDAFSLDGQGPQVLGVLFLAGIAVYVGAMCCVLPGLLMFGLFMLAVPLAIDQKMGTIDAMRASWNAVKPSMWVAMALMVVGSFLMGLSMYVCGVGMLAGAPIYAMLQALVYRDFFIGAPQFSPEVPRAPYDVVERPYDPPPAP